MTPERQTSSNKHLCTNLPQSNRKSFLTPQPNKTKPPLQVLAVVEGNSEKNKVWDGTRDGAINYIKFYLYSITHSVILISYRRLGWSLAWLAKRESPNWLGIFCFVIHSRLEPTKCRWMYSETRYTTRMRHKRCIDHNYLTGNRGKSRECATFIICRCSRIGRPCEINSRPKGHE